MCLENDDDVILEYNDDFIRKEIDTKERNYDFVQHLDDKIDCVGRINNLRQVMNNNRVKKLEQQNKELMDKVQRMEIIINNIINVIHIAEMTNCGSC